MIQSSFLSAQDIVPPPAASFNASSIAVQFFQGIMGFFIPLMAIVGSYSSYGKDRVTGVLESVLSRPVTRNGLAASRYLSTFLALGVAITISVAVIDIILKVFGGSFLDTSLLLSAVGAFLVELAAFVGLMFLFSHLVKSSGLLIGVGIGLFVVLDFLWGLIVLLVAALMGATPGSAGYVQASIISYFINPAQFITLVSAYLTNQFGFTPIRPSVYGITIASLVADASLWTASPLAVFMYLASKRD